MSQIPGNTVVAYAEAIAALRRFLDGLSGAPLDDPALHLIADELDGWSRRFGSRGAEREEDIAARYGLPSRGRAMVPPIEVLEQTKDALAGTVSFGHHFHGRNGAAHGGAVAIVFDEAFGRLVNAGEQPRARTAWLNVDFHYVVPIERPMLLRVDVTRREARKRFVRASLFDGDRPCADAEALLVELRPGQP